VSETYLRVCTLERGHAGDHLPYKDAPDKDEFGNKEIAQPRCVHVSPVEDAPEDRFRVVFELVDPRMPEAGWHDVVRETHDLGDAQSQVAGLRQLELEGEKIRNARIQRARITWEVIG
jgi:hypothetical protein